MSFLNTVLLIAALATSTHSPSQAPPIVQTMSVSATTPDYQGRLHNSIVSFLGSLDSEQRMMALAVLYQNSEPAESFSTLVKVFGRKRVLPHFRGDPHIYIKVSGGHDVALSEEAAVVWVTFHQDLVYHLLTEGNESLESQLGSMNIPA